MSKANLLIDQCLKKLLELKKKQYFVYLLTSQLIWKFNTKPLKASVFEEISPR